MAALALWWCAAGALFAQPNQPRTEQQPILRTTTQPAYTAPDVHYTPVATPATAAADAADAAAANPTAETGRAACRARA